MKATVTIQGEPYGEMDLQPEFRMGQLFQPEGRAYFCPDCGELWASIRVEGRPSRVVTIACLTHHRHAYWPGGSIWLSWEPHLMRELPPAALAYEAKRHVAIFDEMEGA
jgi:hypothetical protein